MMILYSVLSSLIVALLGTLGASIKMLYKRQKHLDSGVKALLHNDLWGLYRECKGKGYADIDDLRNLEYVYQPYHALGGNGTGTELYSRIKKMPDKPAEME